LTWSGTKRERDGIELHLLDAAHIDAGKLGLARLAGHRFRQAAGADQLGLLADEMREGTERLQDGLDQGAR
jgi:hypothetical protein